MDRRHKWKFKLRNYWGKWYTCKVCAKSYWEPNYDHLLSVTLRGYRLKFRDNVMRANPLWRFAAAFGQKGDSNLEK